MDNRSNNILDFEDPGMLADELLHVPGFVNELMSHTLAVSPRPNKPLAFAGALAMTAHLSGRTYRDVRGTRTNLYLAALAPSGMGKDEPRVVNKRLADGAGSLASVPDSIASGQGLEDAMAESPSLLLQCDEADTLLTAMRGEGSNASKMNEMILRFFSEAKSAHAMRQKAGDGKVRIIPQPHLTLFATGIPKFFYSALTAKSLENGLLGRCLFIESDEFYPLGDPIETPLPESVVETAKFWAEQERRAQASGEITPYVIGETPEANAKLRQLKDTCDEVTKRLMASDLGTAAALYVRIPEKATKLALLYALSANPTNPVVSLEAIDWGAKVVTHLTKRMLYMAQFYVAEGKFDRLKKRAMAFLASAGGRLDRTSFLRKLKIDAITFKKLILTLEMSDLVESEIGEYGKVTYSLMAE